MAIANIPAVLNFTKVELPSIIPYNKINSLPKRDDFIPVEAKNAVKAALKISAPMLFMPTDVREMHIQDEKYAKAKYKIVLFGILRTGQKACVVLNGIEPYFEIRLKALELPFDKWPVDKKDIEKVRAATGEKKEKMLTILREAARNVIVDEILEGLQGDQVPIRTEFIEAKPFKYFQEYKSEFLRLYYNKSKFRTDAIKTVRTLGYETCTDDRSAYHHVEMRNRELSFSSWCIVNNYTLVDYQQIKVSPTLSLDISDISNFRGDLSSDDNKDLLKDNTITCTWDIETHDVSRDLPLPTSRTATMFCLCATYQRINDVEPFYKVSFVNLPAAPRPGHVTVVCGSEKNIIKAHAQVFAMMKPEFIAGFNDSEYDWNWYIIRASQYTGLLTTIAPYFDSTKQFMDLDDASILKWNYRTEKVKVEADSYVDGKSLMMAGYLPVDVRTVFRRLYPTSEYSSLNYYLKENKLGSKEDMPYQTMFQIYTEISELLKSIDGKKIHPDFYAGKTIDYQPFINAMTQEQQETFQTLQNRMADVVWYCSVDARKCHDLLRARSVIMDSREVAALSFTTVYDAFYRANGMKVRNLTIGIGQRSYFNYRFTNISQEAMEDGKYPGAWVFPPDKGVKASKLSIRERVQKSKQKNPILKELPDNLTEWDNTTDEEILEYERIIDKYGAICDNDTIEKIEQAEGPQPLHFKEFLKEPIGRPITGLDFSSLYPSLIRTYNFSPEYCILNPAQAREYQQKMQEKFPEEKKFLIQVKFDFNGIPRNAYFVWHRNKIVLPKDAEEKAANGEPIDFNFGVYPFILDDLFNKRKQIKNIMKKYTHRKEEIEAMSEEKQKELSEEYAEISFQIAYLNSKQNALKVFMNTFYGEAGSKISPFFVLELAGGITTYGKRAIMFAHTYVKNQKCKVYYGDSVEESTPVLIKKNGNISFTRIDSLATEYQKYNAEFSPEPKEISFPEDLYVWSDSGWTKVKKIIRHATTKILYRVNTHQGSVVVTQDHSLLDDKKQTLQPLSAQGKQLLVHTPPIEIVYPELSPEASHCIGHALYCCIHSIVKFHTKVSALGLAEIRKNFLVEKIQCAGVPQMLCWQIALAVYGEKIVDYVRAFSTSARHTVNSIPYLVVGNKEQWLNGFIGNDYETYDPRRRVAVPVEQANIAAQIIAVFRHCHDSVRLKITDGCYEIRVVNDVPVRNQVLSVEPMPLGVRTVYDLETESHHFAAGVGDIIVHNTDSLYLSVPELTFEEIDKQFYSNKIDKLTYWKKLVELTFIAIDSIREGVNKEFIRDTMTHFMSMAYEEVLYPMVPVAKKKYWGIAHENIANFKPRKLFIRGLEVKKRGVSELLRNACMDIMWKCCSVDNIHTLLELVVMKIDEIYHTKWDPVDFIQKGVYKPNKNNVRICTFVERMKAIGIEIKPNERFDYVMVEKYPYKYDYRGRKVELSAGDKMELKEQAVLHGYKIDLDYYMTGSVNGQLARFATYHPMFHVEPTGETPDDLKIAEDKIYENACKFVESIASKYYAKYNTYGKACQSIFRTVNKVVGGALKKYDDFAADILTSNIKIDEFDHWIMESAQKKAAKDAKNHGSEFITGKIDAIVAKFLKDNKVKFQKDLNKPLQQQLQNLREQTLIDLQKAYYASGKNSILSMREKQFEEQLAILRSRINSNINNISQMLNKFSLTIEELSGMLKEKLNIAELEKPVKEEKEISLDDANIDLDSYTKELTKRTNSAIKKLFEDEKFLEYFAEFKSIYTNIQGAYSFIEKTHSIVDELKMRKVRSTGITIRPSEETIKAAIDSAIIEDSEELRNLDL